MGTTQKQYIATDDSETELI